MWHVGYTYVRPLPVCTTWARVSDTGFPGFTMSHWGRKSFETFVSQEDRNDPGGLPTYLSYWQNWRKGYRIVQIVRSVQIVKRSINTPCEIKLTSFQSSMFGCNVNNCPKVESSRAESDWSVSQVTFDRALLLPVDGSCYRTLNHGFARLTLRFLGCVVVYSSEKRKNVWSRGEACSTSMFFGV